MITDHEVKALLPHTFRHSVAILQYHSRNNNSVGSGTLVQIGSRFFVATAAHNLTSIDDEFLYLVHTKEVSFKKVTFERRWPLSNSCEPDIDLGYIEISTNEAKLMHEKSFLSLAMIKPFVTFWSTRVFLNGFPSELISKGLAQLQNIFNLSGIGYLTETRKPNDIKNNYDELRDIFVDYEKTSLFVDDQAPPSPSMPQPYGISGGGLWALPQIQEGKLWTPQDAMLIGIERSWLKNSQAVICTQIQHWLRLIANDYSDLKYLIDEHLESCS